MNIKSSDNKVLGTVANALENRIRIKRDIDKLLTI